MEMEASTNTQATASPAPPKFSRYRSVRKAASAVKSPPPSLPQPNPDVKRSMSRYHKVRPVNTPNSAPPVPNFAASAVEKARLERNLGNGQSGPSNNRGRGQTQPTQHKSAYPLPKRSRTMPISQEDALKQSHSREGLPKPRRKNTDGSHPDSADSNDLDFDNDAQRQAYAILNGEVDRQKKLRDTQAEKERARRKVLQAEEMARRKAVEEEERHKREEEERLQLEAVEREQARIAEREAVLAEKDATRARRQAEKERKQSIKGPRRRNTPPEEDISDYRNVSSPEKAGNSPFSKKTSTPVRSPPKSSRIPDAAPKISLGFDAPVSAVNAGTRKVVVKYNDDETEVSVTPTSTSVDILKSAAENLKVNIDPHKSILAESFRQVGLERPLRRYEHIREVMNSWDTDDQNSFLILLAETGEGAALEVRDAPKEQPNDISIFMYYSNKPGSWDKRWITLRADGQVLMSKSPGVDQKNICHMTDFDIYIPTPKRLKKIRPPKKYSFAIKSLQKSSMFLSTANFVHFVSTKDKQQASAFYSAVQSWRSWYLVHELGQGTKRESAAPTIKQRSLSMSSIVKPYELGSFKPFASDDMFGSLMDDVMAKHKDPSSTGFNNRGGPPVSFPKRLVKEPPPVPTTSQAIPSDPFTSGGLLGRTYSQRQAALASRPHRQPSVSKKPHAGMSGQKPLVDLTPTYKEPPQHLHKGHGFVPDGPVEGGLVNMATGREEVMLGTYNAPVIFKPQENSGMPRRSGTVRSTRPKTSGDDSVRPGTAGVPNLPSAFTGGGLLSHADEGIGGRSLGRGISNGDRNATCPLLNMDGGAQYAPGSLLDSVERWEESEGKEKHVIDREKRSEGTVKVGEGL